MKLRAAGAIAVLVASLGACGSGDETTSFGAAPTLRAGLPSTPSTQVDPTVSSTPSASAPTSAADTRPRLGQPFSFANGLKARVDRPVRFTPADSVPLRPGTPVMLTVVLVNAGIDSFDPRDLKVSVGSAGLPAEQIFDRSKQVVARPDKKVAAGTSRKFIVGFWVSDPSNLAVAFTPGSQYPTVTIVS